jgi:hypothetical protein
VFEHHLGRDRSDVRDRCPTSTCSSSIDRDGPPLALSPSGKHIAKHLAHGRVSEIAADHEREEAHV